MNNLDSQYINIVSVLNYDRFYHTLKVVENVKEILKLRGIHPTEENHNLYIKCAYLHDIGYADRYNKNNFHPYDGYMYLKNEEYDETIQNVVLHHTFSQRLFELQEGKFSGDILTIYNELPYTSLSILEKDILQVVTLADLMSDAKGKRVTISERVRDISKRYGVGNTLTTHILEVKSSVLNSKLYKEIGDYL